MCKKSLSYGVARGKVAFVVSDKKPLCLCARKDDAMKQKREGWFQFEFNSFLDDCRESCCERFLFFFSSFSPFCLHKTAKFSFYTRKHTNTQSAHYEYTVSR